MWLENYTIKRNFKILSIDHVAIATSNMEILKSVFIDILGMGYKEKQYIPNEKVDVLKIYADNKQTAIELLEPSDGDSPIEKYLKNKGTGIHHIALTVDNLENIIEYLINKNISLVYEKPQNGADNKLITFIHPKSTPGILVELCQKT